MKYMTNAHSGSCGGHACACRRQPQQACRTVEPVCSPLPVMAFVEPQVWDCVYSCGQALSHGTLFPALDKPFSGKGGCCNG